MTKQILEFEKPLAKAREELEELRRKHDAKPSERTAATIANLERKIEQFAQETWFTQPDNFLWLKVRFLTSEKLMAK